MKTLLLSAFVSIFTIGLHAQDFEVPADYKFETADDYPQYEEDVMNGFDWIMETPYGEQDEKRNEVNKFLITWIMGSPSVSIELNENIVTFMKSSPETLIIFLGGWTNYTLENDHSKDKTEGTKAAVNAVIEFYQNNRKKLGKDKNIEKYVKMKDAGTLDDYIKENA
jgi:hypothetical protein